MTDPPPHEPPASRRAARAHRVEVDRRAPARMDRPERPPARHARTARLSRGLALALALALGGGLLVGAAVAVTALVAEPSGDAGAIVPIATVQALPVPQVHQVPASNEICTVPEVEAALAAGDDARTIAAAGGANAFRAAVAEGAAPCVDMADPARVWTVVNKSRPYEPRDYAPAGLAMADGVRSLEGGSLRTDAAAALSAMAAAARAAGAGEIALESGFRSASVQQASYDRHVRARGPEQADLVSARPGHSEHQSGLAADVVACEGECGAIDALASTPQGEWLAAHAWEHGWIVRYEDGRTDVTGYLPEPWHLRFVGADLARAYHEGQWHTLEEFFGLEPAPDYVG